MATRSLPQDVITSITCFHDFEHDVEPHLNTSIRKIMTNMERSPLVINVAEQMDKLQSIGDLLGIAFAHTQGYDCSVQVVSMLTKYQLLGKDTQFACGDFLMASMEALEYHQVALELASEDMVASLEILEETAKIATKMVKVADSLVKRASDMIELGDTALKTATQDKNIEDNKKKTIAKLMTDLQAKEEKLKAERTNLKKQIEEADKQERAAAAEPMGFGEFLIGAAGAIFGNSVEREATAREKRYHEQQVKLRAEDRKANADLAEAVSQLANTKGESDTIDQAMVALTVAVKTLSRIHTVFIATRDFWISVAKMCTKLADTEKASLYAKHKTNKMFIKNIHESFYSWLVFAKINNTALVSMKAVVANVDGVMNNLPVTPAEVDARLPKLLAELHRLAIEDEEKLKEQEQAEPVPVVEAHAG